MKQGRMSGRGTGMSAVSGLQANFATPRGELPVQACGAPSSSTHALQQTLRIVNENELICKNTKDDY